MIRAFINRFDAIYFDEQLNIESLEKINEFIAYLLNKIEYQIILKKITLMINHRN